jgi:glycosyltransferase involved in cell wall biosynthesis
MKLGHDVDLVTYPFGESPELSGLRIVRSARPPGVRDVRIGPSVAKIALDVPLFSKARGLARTGSYDLLHTHEEAGIFGAWLSRAVGLPHLYDMHSSLPQQFENFGRFNLAPIVAGFRAAERYTLSGADGVIVICPDLLDHVNGMAYAGPLELIENTLDFDPPNDLPALARDLRHRLSLNDQRVVLYTGTLERYQGLDLLIAAASKVLQQVPDARFVLVGGTAEQIAALRKLAAEHAVEHALVFVGSVPATDVFAYLQLADVLVSTRARGTNTPLKIYQYLRAGKPIVATRIHSHTQALDESSAHLVEPTPDDIAEGLRRVLTTPPYAERLSFGARSLSETRYSEAEYMERLGRVLDRTLAAHAARTA